MTIFADREPIETGVNPVSGAPYMTVKQAAIFLCVSEATIRHFLTIRKLRRFKVGSRTLILRADAQALVREEA